jgi:hypothetical protein
LPLGISTIAQERISFVQKQPMRQLPWGADVLVFTEFFPREYEKLFRATLSNAGWTEQLISEQPRQIANRVLIASKLPLSPMTLDLPTFDQQFPANILGVQLPSLGLSIVGVRVPAYSSKTRTAHLLFPAWDWLETTAASLKSSPAVIIDDLNIQTSSGASRAGDHFRRILANGWHCAAPGGATFFGHKGRPAKLITSLQQTAAFSAMRHAFKGSEASCSRVRRAPSPIMQL